jgi:hypothetical protein
MAIAVSLTCSKQSKHGEAENTTNDPLTAAGSVAGLAAPGTLPRLLLPMFMMPPVFLLQEHGHGVLVHIWVFAWR